MGSGDESLKSQDYQEDLAYIHHVGFSNLARQAAPWVLEALRKADIHEGTVVELGCGTGILLSALSAVGYQAVGIDASAAMLDIASSTAPDATLVHASLYDAVIPPCRAILAMGEPFNYVSGPGSEPPTAQVFSQAAEALPAGGLLLFDAMIRSRTDYKPFRSWASGSDWACLFDSLPDADGNHLRRAITMFRLVGDAYRRGEEEHWVHLFSRALLTRQLEQAGFTVRTASTYGRVRLSPGRRLFHCRRVGAGPTGRAHILGTSGFAPGEGIYSSCSEVSPMSTTIQTPITADDRMESPLEPEERERILRALDALLEGDEEEQRETFAFLKKALDEDRPSYRKLFPLGE